VKDLQSLAHVKWECKYHIVWVPKYRRMASLYGKIRKRLGEIVRELGRQKGIEVIERQALIDHLHVCLSFPPKDGIPNVTGFLRRKSAIRLHLPSFSQAILNTGAKSVLILWKPGSHLFSKNEVWLGSKGFELNPPTLPSNPY